MTDTYVVFDIGGTNTRIATATKDALGEIKKVPTLQNPDEGLKVIHDFALELAGEAQITAVAGCVAGNITEEGVIDDARNLRSWEGTNIVQKVSDMFGIPATIANDAGVVGLGEAFVGAGKGASALVYVTVSTGVGGARIVDGNIDAAGGVGWIKVNGTDLESQISGTAIKKKFDIHPKDLDSLEERNKLADILAEGLAILIEKWTPDTIVLGGSMIVGVNPIPMDRTLESLSKTVAQEKMPTLKMATLGDSGGLEGARILASRAS